MSELLERVQTEIDSKWSRDTPRSRIFLSPNDWFALWKELGPIYNDRYGALVQDESAFRDGWENILYRGCAICLERGDVKK